MKATATATNTNQKPSTLLRKGKVLERVPLSSTTLWRLCRSGAFPAPVRISTNAVAWRESDVEEWIQKQRG